MSVSKETAHLPSYGRILYDKVSNSGLCSQVQTNTTVFFISCLLQIWCLLSRLSHFRHDNKKKKVILTSIKMWNLDTILPTSHNQNNNIVFCLSQCNSHIVTIYIIFIFKVLCFGPFGSFTDFQYFILC